MNYVDQATLLPQQQLCPFLYNIQCTRVGLLLPSTLADGTVSARQNYLMQHCNSYMHANINSGDTDTMITYSPSLLTQSHPWATLILSLCKTQSEKYSSPCSQLLPLEVLHFSVSLIHFHTIHIFWQENIICRYTTAKE